MSSLQRYLLRQQSIAMVFVTLVLGFAIWLTQSLNFIKFIITRGLSLGVFFKLTLFLLPSFLLIILPLALFFAVTFTYNKLINDRELVVMRATGLSQIGLAGPAIVLAGFVTLIAYFLSLYLVPTLFARFKQMEFSIRNDYSAILLQEGRFNTVGKGVTIYIRDRTGAGELVDILIQDDRDTSKPVTMTAERGAMVNTPSGTRVVLVNGSRQEVDRKTGRLSLLNFERHSFDIDWLSKRSEKRWRDPTERFVWELLNPGDSPGERYYAKKLKAEGHNRLVTPLFSLVFVFVACAVLLSGEFDKRGQTRRLLIAAGAIIAIQAAAVGLTNFAAKIPAMVPLMYLNAVVPLAIAAYVLVRSPGRRRRQLGPETAVDAR